MITGGVTHKPPDRRGTGRKRTASRSHAPVAPATWHAWLRSWRRGVVAARADDVFLYASALAFYGLISVAPLVVVALWVTSVLVSDSQVHDIAEGLARFAPAALGADRAFERIADLGTGLGLLAVVAALWPATAYGSALAHVLDRLAGLRLGVNLERQYASDALAAVVLLGLWLFAANATLLLAFRSACLGGVSRAST